MNAIRNDHAAVTSWTTIIFLIALCQIAYLIVNYLPLQRTIAPYLFDEQYIPFLPWTLGVYLSAFVLAAIVIRRIPPPLLPRFVFLVFIMASIGFAFFVLFPLQYPRFSYSSGGLFGIFWRIDGPGNCFPSLHVAMVVLMSVCYTQLEKSLVRRSLMWLWALVIIISVLTTKQHYVMDVIGGALLAIPFGLILNSHFQKAHMQYSGIVQRGKRRGTALGYPTANISLDEPLSGIFTAQVLLGRERYPAVAFADPTRKILEAHILDFSADIYDRPITIELLEKLRENKAFTDDATLRGQIAEDVEAARAYFMKKG
jgi:membrane-associated phospholipid phosphatase